MSEHANLFIVNDHDFAEQVLQSSLPVLVDYTATWCPPCHALNPVYAKLSEEYTGRLRFAKMDVDENQATAARQGIQGMPTLVLYWQGKAIGRLVGPHPARLQAGVERLLAQVSSAV